MIRRGTHGQLGLPGSMTDAALCQVLLEKGSLTDMQMTDVVYSASLVAAGGRLMKNVRDRLMNIAMAQKLTEKTQIKRPKGAPRDANFAGDMYSTWHTAGTEKAAEILAKGKTPSGHMIVPPSRRRVG